MPHGQPHPGKNKNQSKRQNKPESDAQRKPKTTVAAGQDVHRDIPEQRADWEGMAPQSSQVTSKHPESSEQDAPDDSDQMAMEGEGSYSGTRQYNEGLKKSMASGKLEAGAKAARQAVEGPEAEALRRAEQRGKKGPAKRPS